MSPVRRYVRNHFEESEIAALINIWRDGAPSRDALEAAAAKMGRTWQSLATKASRLGLSKSRSFEWQKPVEKTEEVPRCCNLCDRPFVAPTKFIRTCDDCKKTAAWKQGPVTVCGVPI